jgi:uncharacterized protein
VPVAEGNRLSLIDGLRGVALLGILWINMTGHALPFFSMWDPRIAGGDDPLNLGAWAVSEVVIEGAMRGLFSLLFGVSILLFLKDGDRGALFVRRNFWLIVFGCIHGFLLLMPGDILVTYGVCAFLLFPFRNASPRLLAILSAAAVLILAALDFTAASENAAILNAGLVPNAPAEAIAAFEAIKGPPPPVIEELNEKSAIGYPALLPYMAAAYWQTLASFEFPKMIIDALAMMFAGMALYRSGFLMERGAPRRLLLIGATIAVVALVARSFVVWSAFNDDFIDNVNPIAAPLAEIARPALAIAYALIFVGLWRLGALRFAERPLTALGRTAFTHYIGGTLIASMLFYGHGFGLHNQFDRIGVYAIIIAVWIAQTAASLIWLRYFRMGPLEWGWRSLVRMKPQPLRR